jgi:hypothetical protein
VAVADTIELITTGDPLFSGVTFPADVQPWIEMTVAGGEVNSTTFGKLYQNALANLVAHKMAANFAAQQAALGGAGGTPAELRAGKWAIRYQQSSTQASSDSDAVLNETRYGREYLRLRGMCAGFPRVLPLVT